MLFLLSTVFAFLYRMARNLYTHVKFTVTTGSHPVIDTLSSVTGNVILELVEWSRFGI